ncbi:hypothetical protein PHMEG_00026681 [Phytophthora megakarya]|nr:hypothetical protein PHMEG_00026681 [Phytophthora megakarya]
MQSTYSRMRRYQPGSTVSGILKALFQFYHYLKYGRFATNPTNHFPRCISAQLEIIIRLEHHPRKPMSQSLSTKSTSSSSRNTDTSSQGSDAQCEDSLFDEKGGASTIPTALDVVEKTHKSKPSRRKRKLAPTSVTQTSRKTKQRIGKSTPAADSTRMENDAHVGPNIPV